MPETRRLTKSINCPKCHFKVKPFVVRTRALSVQVKCPMLDCRAEWTVTNASEKE